METLIKKINELKKSEIKSRVDERIKFFDSQNKLDSWFSELCFCILTSNSKAKTAICIQEELQENGFLEKEELELAQTIRKNKHRFHNTKAKRIVEARKNRLIKQTIQEIISSNKNHKNGVISAREWLVENIKGLGYKESSHFLRNVGYTNVAILDRHIIKALHNSNYIVHDKNTLSKKQYLEFENILEKICKKLNLTQSELDLYMWYIQTGEILK